ncbi:MAG TPA: aminotransferase class V-fold PLP-dependent enzyme, partial [Candidatus Hydrogenedentes bacterium]|nr:aminotransferase class V-fold PLP-dependent enzyme [Candidatus Hydrogenedentota bacterium]
MQLIFEKSVPGRRAVRFDALDVPEAGLPETLRRREAAALPEAAEIDVVRHFTHLSKRNFGIDSHFYPLGSCTMKYNPKVAEVVAALPGFAQLHPRLANAPEYEDAVQGAYALIYGLEALLAEIGGMRAASIQPIAGAHGELTGALLMAAYHRDRGNAHKDTVLVPDSAHGTNPASAALLGYHVVEIKSNSRGRVDLEDLRAHLDDHVACLMLTNPNTLGVFEEEILEIAKLVHAKGGLLYYDGANLNPLLGIAR